MATRRPRARFFDRAAPSGSSLLTRRRYKFPPLRFVVLIMLTLGAVWGWSFYGGQLMASLNPAIRMQLHMLAPTLDAWITPPDYTGMPPIMIATPVGARYDGSTVEVPIGSTITAHLAESDSEAPDLFINGTRIAFTPDDDGGYKVSQLIKSGDTIAIRRGWQDIDSWHIHILADQAPHVSFLEPPSISERKTVRLSYRATDDYGITSIIARITPHDDEEAIEIPLALPNAKEIQRVSFEDLTAYPWAGQQVKIQLIATNAAGQRMQSESVDFTAPERLFFHPIARALIDERRKLIQNPADENVRNEAANIMAGVAHTPVTYEGDSVVLMALRSGAVRLVLDHSHATIAPVTELMWEAAIRIEDGTVGVAERRLHDAQRELADALDRKAPSNEIQELVDRLREALATYLTALSSRSAHPGPAAQDLSQAAGTQTNKLEPQDIDRTMKKLNDLSVSGASDAARGELMNLQQQLESMGSHHASFSEEMRKRSNAANPDDTHSVIQRLLQNF